MKRDYPDRPIVGVGAVVVERDRVLLIQRAIEPLKGHWTFPGGAVEVGETLREAAAREALEETGLVVEVGEILGVFDRIHRDPEGRVQYHYVLVDFLCRQVGGELHAASDAAAARWVNGEEATGLNVTEIAQRLIRQALSGEPAF